MKGVLHIIADDLDGYESWDEIDWVAFSRWIEVWS